MVSNVKLRLTKYHPSSDILARKRSKLLLPIAPKITTAIILDPCYPKSLLPGLISCCICSCCLVGQQLKFFGCSGLFPPKHKSNLQQSACIPWSSSLGSIEHRNDSVAHPAPMKQLCLGTGQLFTPLKCSGHQSRPGFLQSISAADSFWQGGPRVCSILAQSLKINGRERQTQSYS